MWHPATTDEVSRTRERVAEDDRKRQLRDGKDDADGDSATGNVDSGFLSSGNIQFSGEVCEPAAVILKRRQDGGSNDDNDDNGEQGTAVQPKAVTTATTIVREPMRAVDSGVDLDLSESLSQLSLKQVSLNPLAAKGRVQAEPTDLELSPVSAEPTADDTVGARRRNGSGSDEWRAMIHEEPYWQLYYAQDNDGDT